MGVYLSLFTSHVYCCFADFLFFVHFSVCHFLFRSSIFQCLFSIFSGRFSHYFFCSIFFWFSKRIELIWSGFLLLSRYLLALPAYILRNIYKLFFLFRRISFIFEQGEIRVYVLNANDVRSYKKVLPIFDFSTDFICSHLHCDDVSSNVICRCRYWYNANATAHSSSIGISAPFIRLPLLNFLLFRTISFSTTSNSSNT